MYPYPDEILASEILILVKGLIQPLKTNMKIEILLKNQTALRFLYETYRSRTVWNYWKALINGFGKYDEYVYV